MRVPESFALPEIVMSVVIKSWGTAGLLARRHLAIVGANGKDGV